MPISVPNCQMESRLTKTLVSDVNFPSMSVFDRFLFFQTADLKWAVFAGFLCIKCTIKVCHLLFDFLTDASSCCLHLLDRPWQTARSSRDLIFGRRSAQMAFVVRPTMRKLWPMISRASSWRDAKSNTPSCFCNSQYIVPSLPFLPPFF